MLVVDVVVEVVVVVLVVVLFVFARFADGPIAIIPGGPLQAGELVADPVADWAFAESIDEIEMQLASDDTSRTTWILYQDGNAYIPCSLGFPPGKDWHLRADKDGRAIVRIAVRSSTDGCQNELNPA